MKPRDPAPDRRLITASLLAPVWLAWVFLVPGALPPVVAHPARPPAPAVPGITALVSAAVLVKLWPLMLRGSTRVRLAALAAALGPASVLLWILGWLAGRG